MGKPTTRVVLLSAAVALALGVVGCGSDKGTDATGPQETPTSAPASGSAAPGTSAAADGSAETVGDYLRENNITQTLVKRGEAGAPTLNLPTPPGWKDAGANTPRDAYGAIYLADPALAVSPPAIIARMAKVPADVDQAKILELAPNALRNQPSFDGTAQPSELGGFKATAISGTVDLDGKPVFVARKTVVIPGPDAVFLLALDAQGPPDQQEALMSAMGVIDARTTIET
jgi:hypothetical protein